jgi:50S ribosomal protein L16 3-hydroxylase
MLAHLLGGMTPQQFLAAHWQKKPLLVRQAIPGFDGVLARDELLALSLHDDVESRLVECRAGTWSVKHGPLARTDWRRRAHPWTALVQGVNLHVPAADRLLRRFDFVPWARLDDLMVSYAVDGGGVGPHFDSYDVFLLQARGRRRWRIGAQRDLAVIDGAPLRILRRFKPSREWTLEPGDMLYLPPHYAHDGVALGECMTCSVGFRAPSAQELAARFLAFLEQRIALAGMYRDADLKPPAHPARIGSAMLRHASGILARIRWSDADVREFLGCYLSEPKPHVFFTPPPRPLGLDAFVRRSAERGLRLHAKTQLLFSGPRFYLNGEALAVDREDRQRLRLLADRRALPNLDGMSAAAREMTYDWYRRGYAVLEDERP